MDVNRYEVFNSWMIENYEQITPYGFYSGLWPAGTLQKKGKENFNDGKYCGIAVSLPKEGRYRRYSLCDGLDNLDEILSVDDVSLTIISPVTYAGRRRLQDASRCYYSIQVDLDGVIINSMGTPTGLMNIFHQSDRFICRPTVTAISGNNVHLYYHFLSDEYLMLVPSAITSINRFRRQFISGIYNSDITTEFRRPQIQSFSQGMRAVGSVCKNQNHRVTAFLTGPRYSVAELNKWVSADNQLVKYRPRMDKATAKRLYPGWGKPKQPSRGTMNRAVADWWVEKLKAESVQGFRYNGICMLAVFYQKASLSYDELFDTAMSLVDVLDAKTTDPENRFTRADALKACETFYQPRLHVKRETIERESGIKIPANKRNYRKRSEHLKYMRGIKALRISLGEDKVKGGRPSKEWIVVGYCLSHRDASASQAVRELGLSKKTVYKYWKKIQRIIKQHDIDFSDPEYRELVKMYLRKSEGAD